MFSVFSCFKFFPTLPVLVMSWWDIVTSGHVATWDIGDGAATLRARVDAVLTCVDIDARAGGPEKCDTGDTHRYGMCRATSCILHHFVAECRYVLQVCIHKQ